MKLPCKKVIKNQKETDRLATEFSKSISEGNVIVLNGNIGSGKTYFIKKILHIFGINYVSSPSFAIVNEYDGAIKAYHFDFYRLKKITELYDIGWQDYLNNKESIIFIEWGELLFEALPSKRIEVSIKMLEGSKREFEFVNYE